MNPWRSFATWPLRRWTTALLAAVAAVLAVGIPTNLIPTPFFGREIPPTWWSWPALLASAVVGGLLVATYVGVEEAGPRDPDARRGVAGGLLTFFAVGCPVCNKLVLLALGSAGALTWFEPLQPLLQLAALVLLVWALRTRLAGEQACALPATTAPSDR